MECYCNWIELDTNAPLADSYVADASHYTSNISDAAQGLSFLKQLFDKDFISLSFNYETMKVTISLDVTNARSSCS